MQYRLGRPARLAWVECVDRVSTTSLALFAVYVTVPHAGVLTVTSVLKSNMEVDVR
jgi:hypothetical protein